MTTKPARLDMGDYVHELTETTIHREAMSIVKTFPNGSTTTYDTVHETINPPLIAQLWGSVTPSSQGGEVGVAHPSSRPAASLDAIDAAARIDLKANLWITDLGETAPLDTMAAVRRLNGLAADTDRCGRSAGKAGHPCCTFHAIEVDVRSWWVTARVLTGWDSQTWKPNATCPLCGERRTVSIRLSSQIASCTACHETWDPDTIQLLAEHIRLEAEEGRFRTPPTPVQCHDVEDDDHVWRIMLCPDCGSRKCVKAQALTVGPLTSHRNVRRRHAADGQAS